MESFSLLRLLGVILSTGFIIWTMLYFRGPRWCKFSYLLSIVGGISGLLVSLFPSLINFVYILPTIAESPNGRLTALLICSTIILFFLTIRSTIKHETLKEVTDRLIRNISYITIDEKSLRRLKEETDILIVIPAYNEAGNLPILLPKLPLEIMNLRLTPLIVDDCSTDNTFEIAQKYNAVAVRNIINRGQGGASRLGYDIGRSIAVKAVVTMDADNQHRVEDLPSILKPILENDADLVIGSRVLCEQQKGFNVRELGIFTLSLLISLLTGKKITDVSSGYKAFSLNALSKLDLREDQFQSSEVITLAVKANLKVQEVPIVIENRLFGNSKKGTNLKYGVGFTKTLIKSWWR